MWFDILKNIQISGQKTTSRDVVSPEDEDEDCFKYFYDLVKLLDERFELKRTVFPEDYWCELFHQEWVIEEDYKQVVGYLGKNPESKTGLGYDIEVYIREDSYIDIIFGEEGEGHEFAVKHPDGVRLMGGDGYYHESIPNLKYENFNRVNYIAIQVYKHMRDK